MHSRQKRERLREFEELCRRRGLALTAQRRAVLEVLLARQDHPTPERVYEQVRQRIPDISRTTVYRVLDTLVAVGAITKACSPSAATRFDPDIRRHHHLVCLHCDRLIDIDDPKLDRFAALPVVHRHSFKIRDFSIHFHGICAACRRKSTAKEDAMVRASKKAARSQKTSRNLKRRNRA